MVWHGWYHHSDLQDLVKALPLKYNQSWKASGATFPFLSLLGYSCDSWTFKWPDPPLFPSPMHSTGITCSYALHQQETKELFLWMQETKGWWTDKQMTDLQDVVLYLCSKEKRWIFFFFLFLPPPLFFFPWNIIYNQQHVEVSTCCLLRQCLYSSMVVMKVASSPSHRRIKVTWSVQTCPFWLFTVNQKALLYLRKHGLFILLLFSGTSVTG